MSEDLPEPVKPPGRELTGNVVRRMDQEGQGQRDPYKEAADPFYDARFCDDIQDMARDMMFPEEWAAQIGVTEARLLRWTVQFPGFAEAFAVAVTILRATFTAELREAARGKKAFSHAPLYAMFARKRFPDLYGDQSDQKPPAAPPGPRDITPASEAIIDADRPVQDMATDELQKELDRLRARQR